MVGRGRPYPAHKATTMSERCIPRLRLSPSAATTRSFAHGHTLLTPKSFFLSKLIDLRCKRLESLLPIPNVYESFAVDRLVDLQ